MSDTTANTERPTPIITNFTSEYWKTAANGQLVLQYCKATGQYQHFPRPVSIHNGRRELEWRPVSGKGVVYSYTVTRRAPPPFRGKEPYVVAIVELDEGVRFMSNVINCDPDKVAIGMRVRATWEKLSNGDNVLLFEPDPGKA